MITEKEKKLIIDTIGNHYSEKILQHLKKKNILGKNGEYSKGYIRQIVGGFEENQEVEIELLKFVSSTKKKQKKALELRKNLLKS